MLMSEWWDWCEANQVVGYLRWGLLFSDPSDRFLAREALFPPNGAPGLDSDFVLNLFGEQSESQGISLSDWIHESQIASLPGWLVSAGAVRYGPQALSDRDRELLLRAFAEGKATEAMILLQRLLTRD
jgi:hypothetical protein